MTSCSVKVAVPTRTKELDFLLNRYLETGYLVADQGERDLFVELLGMEDDVLVGVLMGDLVVGRMEELIRNVRTVAVAVRRYHG